MTDFFQADDDIIYFNEHIAQNELEILFNELDLPFTEDDIKRGLTSVHNGKSAGPDLLINEFLINRKHAFSSYLTLLFNRIFEIGYFLEQWSEGLIVPIHKKGSLSEVDNFRGITLLSVLGKLFTNIINKRLCTWAEE